MSDRHLTPEEQAVMSEALGKSVRIVASPARDAATPSNTIPEAAVEAAISAGEVAFDALADEPAVKRYGVPSAFHPSVFRAALAAALPLMQQQAASRIEELERENASIKSQAEQFAIEAGHEAGARNARLTRAIDMLKELEAAARPFEPGNMGYDGWAESKLRKAGKRARALIEELSDGK